MYILYDIEINEQNSKYGTHGVDCVMTINDNKYLYSIFKSLRRSGFYIIFINLM